MNFATQERTSFYSNIFTCAVDGNNIFQTDYMGNRIGVLGVSTSAYNELKKICDQYYDKLVELGVLQKEKTPQEIAEEQRKIMSDMMIQMKSLQEELNSIKDRNNVQSSKLDSGSNESVRDEPRETIEIKPSNSKSSGANGKK